MYRLYYINSGDPEFYWQTGHRWKDFDSVGDCMDFVSKNYWDWDGENIVKGVITIELIAQIEEKEIMGKKRSSCCRGCRQG